MAKSNLSLCGEGVAVLCTLLVFGGVQYGLKGLGFGDSGFVLRT